MEHALCNALFAFGASHILFGGTNVFTLCASRAQDPIFGKGYPNFLETVLAQKIAPNEGGGKVCRP